MEFENENLYFPEEFLFGKYEFYSLNFLGEKIIFPRAIFLFGKYKSIIFTYNIYIKQLNSYFPEEILFGKYKIYHF